MFPDDLGVVLAPRFEHEELHRQIGVGVDLAHIGGHLPSKCLLHDLGEVALHGRLEAAAYLEHRLSIADAAAALIIHPHTLRYRLSRIEALLKLSLREPEAMLRLRLAMMIRDIVAP